MMTRIQCSPASPARRRWIFVTLALVGFGARFTPAAQFIDRFEGLADPVSPSNGGWSIVWDSNLPVSATTNFWTNDASCEIKITAVPDGITGFTSAYLFVEHDIDEANETTVPGNLYGQDAGDILLTTEKPARQLYAAFLDLNGARFRIRHNGGWGGAGPAFFFAVVLTNNSRWVMGDQIAAPAGGPFTKTTDPIDATVTEWRSIIYGSSAPGQRLRIADTPVLLSAAQLSAVKAVGLYVWPGAAPSRFDDFELLDYQVASDYSSFRITDIAGTNDAVLVTWNAQGGRAYQLQRASTPHPGSYTNVEGPVAAPGFSSVTASLLDTNGAGAQLYRVELIPITP